MEPSRNLGSEARKKQSFFFSVLSLFCYHFLKIEGLLFSYYIFSFLEKLITPKNTCEKKRSESKGEKERYKHLNGEGNGTPVQYSCLENPMDGGAWQAAVHGVAKSWTRLHFHFHFSLSFIGGGNGNPLQCSCLENPRDGEAWWASIYGVAQSRTRLK